MTSRLLSALHIDLEDQSTWTIDLFPLKNFLAVQSLIFFTSLYFKYSLTRSHTQFHLILSFSVDLYTPRKMLVYRNPSTSLVSTFPIACRRFYGACMRFYRRLTGDIKTLTNFQRLQTIFIQLKIS